MSGDNVSQLFNVWAQNGRSDTMATGHENAVKFMLSRLGSLEGRRFLDVGCGNGWVVRRVAEQACDCAVGIDIAPQMIRVAQERRQRETETYIVGDFCDYSFKQRFDIIFSMESIYYVDELSLALNRAYALLNPGGCLMMGLDYYSENTASHDWPDLLGLPFHLLSMSEWSVALEGAGFIDIECDQIREPDAQDDWKRGVGTLVLKSVKTFEDS